MFSAFYYAFSVICLGSTSFLDFSYTILLAVKKYGVRVVSGMFAMFYYDFSVIYLGPTPFPNQKRAEELTG